MASLSIQSIAQSNTAVNLSSPVRSDWQKAGDSGNTLTVNTKSGGGSTITLGLYGTTPGVAVFTDSTRPISYTDGTSPTSATTNTNGLYDTANGGGTSNAGDGFTLTFPAGTGTRRATVYAGCYASRVTVQASLSDGSAASVSDTTTIDDADLNGSAGFVTFEYAAASAGQTLLVNVFSNLSRGAFSNVTYSGSEWISLSADTPLNPAQDAIALTGQTPTLARTAHQAVNPAQDSIAISGQVPTVAQSANQAVSPATDGVVLTGFAPTIAQAAASLVFTPAAAMLSITGYAPEGSAAAAAGDYEKRRKRRVLEALALQVMEDEQDEESEPAPLLQPKIRAVEVKAKQFPAKKQQAPAKRANDDEDEFEAMMLLT